MSSETQTYATHRQYVPLFHFVVAPILGINIIVQVVVLFRQPTLMAGWNVLLAFALGVFAWTARPMVTRAQDRLIRLEETLRLQRCLPPELRGRIGELTPGQLIGLRFCSDEEVAELARVVLAGELKGREEIKRRIRNWRPDTLRV